MDVDAPEPKARKETFEAFTREERIEQLNEIDENIAKLLEHAGSATKALANQHSEDGSPLSLEEQKQAFQTAASQYFSLLSSVDVNLRRQIYALEEANIISAEGATKETHASQDQQGKDRNAPNVAGLGSLDVGWLNSRNDKVGKEMEAELWADVKDLVERIERTKNTKKGSLEAA